jgi:hypothetical protein
VIATVPVVLAIAGPLRASAWVSGCSIPVLFALAFATGGAGAVPAPTASQAAAIAYLAVVVCAGGFYLLYSALPRLGADRVGLFAGLVPFGAIGAELLLGAGTIGPADVAGAVLVAAGVALAISGPFPRRGRRANGTTEGKGYGGGAAARPDADGGTACLAHIARTGAPRGAAPPHSVTIQACPYMYKS